jgi:2'-5' RNA ligase
MPTGAMVALYLPSEVAQKIALPGGEEPAELHCTLAYLGEASDIEDPEKLRRQVKAFAALYQPIRARIGGIGKFNRINEEGTQAFWASFEAPELPRLRERLLEMLQDVGFEQATNYGFTPHITLKYLKPGEPLPLQDIPEMDFTVDRVSLALAGNREDYALGEVVKAVEGGTWQGFCDLFKIIDEEERIIEAVASAPTPDGQAGTWLGQAYDADVVEPDAIRQALPDYMQWANLREMHQPSAAGVVLDAWISEEPIQVNGKLVQNPLIIRAKVVDDIAWKKVKEGVYKGLSIGGKVLEAIIGKLGNQIVRFIKALKLVEISLVDRPQNPDARILLWKGEIDMPEKTDKMDYRKNAIEALRGMRSEYEEKGNWKAAKGCSRVMEMIAGMGMDENEPDEDKAEKSELAELLKSITPDDEALQKVVQLVEGPVQDSLAKVLETASGLAAELKEAKETLATTQETLTKMETRLEAIEKQPVGGGPAVRAAEKTLPTDQPDKSKGETKISKAQLTELKQKANTEPNPALRADYQRQYTAALEALAA